MSNSYRRRVKEESSRRLVELTLPSPKNKVLRSKRAKQEIKRGANYLHFTARLPSCKRLIKTEENNIVVLEQ